LRHNPDHSEAACGQAGLEDYNAFVVRRHGAIKRSRPLDHPGAIILLRRKPATKVVVSHFPSGRWPILEAVSNPGKIKDSCGRI
jgi:hypothetical protein